jgi:exonuclease III
VKCIVSYNVNGIRSAMSKGLSDFIKNFNPDIVCLQETKAQSGQLHEADFNRLGYYMSSFSAVKRVNLSDNVIDAGILPLVVHSDHCPVWVKLNV